MLLKEEKGAASVLVIFMLIVLVTLGAFAITSANVNYKFSMRAFEWNTLFYELDARGEDYLMALDSKLAEAETKAREYVESNSYTAAQNSGLPDVMQADLFEEYAGIDLDGDDVNELINKIYLYYADKYLNDLCDTYRELEVYTSTNSGFVSDIYTFMDIRSELHESDGYGLNISVYVEPLEYSLSGSGSNLSIVRANSNLRYKIKDWYEHQAPLRDENRVKEVWDGTLN